MIKKFYVVFMTVSKLHCLRFKSSLSSINGFFDSIGWIVETFSFFILSVFLARSKASSHSLFKY